MLNNVSLMGRLTADPELKHTPSGVAVTTFTLAVNRSYVKQGAERQADFIDIVAWRNTAEFICKYFRKGQMIALEGSIQTRIYTDKDNKNRKAFEILANNVFFAEGKRGADVDRGYDDSPATTESEPEEYAPISDDEDLPF